MQSDGGRRPPNITVVGFGSCRKHTYPQPIMDAIAAMRPRMDMWVWLGDYLYFKPNGSARALEEAYREAFESEGEHRLREAVRSEQVWRARDGGVTVV